MGVNGTVLYVGACTEFHSKPYPTRQQAEQWCAGVDHMGSCRKEHKVVEVYPDSRGVYRFPDGRMVKG
jgi:hypothetical protein